MDKELDVATEERTPERTIESEAAVKPRQETRAHIQKLPFEILSEIFILCGKAQRLAPAIIAMVCRLWRAIVLSTPRAWIYISFFEEAYDGLLLPSFASTCLTRSRSCPLHVNIYTRPCTCSYNTKYHPCTCPSGYLKPMRLVLGATHRVSCLKIDHQWAKELDGKSYPNLKSLVLFQANREPYEFSLDISLFEGLEYLDLPPLMSSDELDVTDLTRLPLRYLAICATEEGSWLQVTRVCARTLHTLNLTIRFYPIEPLQWHLDLPVLESLTIKDDSHLDGGESGILELKTPRVRFYSYEGREKRSMRIIPSCEMSQLVHLRTQPPFRFAHYTHLQILQIHLRSITVTSVENVLEQLEANLEATSRLHTIELKTSNWVHYEFRELVSKWRKRVGVDISFVDKDWS